MMKFAVCLALVVIATLFAAGASHQFCCDACFQTQNVTRREYVNDRVCTSAVIGEQRCFYRGWWPRRRRICSTVYRRVIPQVQVDVMREVQFCNRTCLQTECQFG